MPVDEANPLAVTCREKIMIPDVARNPEKPVRDSLTAAPCDRFPPIRPFLPTGRKRPPGGFRSTTGLFPIP